MVTLENIGQHTIPFDQFELKWRFTEEKYNVLPLHHLEQIKPLDKPASAMLNALTHTLVSSQFRLDAGRFEHIEAIDVPDGFDDETTIKGWLHQRKLPPDREVYISWHSNFGAITTWEMVIKYWSDFWYPMSDDLIVVDKTFGWALAVYHYEQMEFGIGSKRNNEICENELGGTETY